MHGVTRPLWFLTLLPALFAPGARAAQPSASDAPEIEAAEVVEVVESVEPDSAPEEKDAANEKRTEEDEVTTGEAFLRKLKQGGRTMIFLLLCSVVAVACAFERLVPQRRRRIVPANLVARADRMWSAGEFDQLEAMGLKNRAWPSRSRRWCCTTGSRAGSASTASSWRSRSAC